MRSEDHRVWSVILLFQLFAGISGALIALIFARPGSLLAEAPLPFSPLIVGLLPAITLLCTGVDRLIGRPTASR